MVGLMKKKRSGDASSSGKRKMDKWFPSEGSGESGGQVGAKGPLGPQEPHQEPHQEPQGPAEAATTDKSESELGSGEKEARETNSHAEEVHAETRAHAASEEQEECVELVANSKSAAESKEGGIVITQRPSKGDNNDYDDDDSQEDAAESREDLAASRSGDADAVHSPRQGSSSTRPSEKLLRSRHESACRYLRMGHFNKALRKFEDVRDTLEGYYGREHHRVGGCLHNIGIVHLRAGNLDDAMKALEEAVQIRKSTLGDFHSKAADSLVELGIVLLSKREFDDAQDVFNEALELRERERANSTQDEDENIIDNKVAKVLNNLGCVHYEYGDLREARAAFEEALEIQREVIGDGDPGTEPGCLAMASTMCNIGYVYLEGRKYEEAIVIMEEANEILQSILEPENKLVLNTLDNLAYAYARSGNYDAALKNYEEKYFSEEEIKSEGTDQLECAETLRKMAYCHLKITNHEKALDCLYKAEAIQVKLLSPDSRKLQKTREMIGVVKYQILKFPGCKEIFFRMITRTGLRNPFDNGLCECTCAGPTLEEDDIGQHILKRPQNSSKMSGHKVTYA